jgi:hypothetical protein
MVEQLEKIGIFIQNGVVTATSFVAETMKVGRAEITELEGEKAKLRGLELIDEQTGDTYCVKISGGELKKTLGACGAVTTSLAIPVTEGEQSSVPPEQPQGEVSEEVRATAVPVEADTLPATPAEDENTSTENGAHDENVSIPADAAASLEEQNESSIQEMPETGMVGE